MDVANSIKSKFEEIQLLRHTWWYWAIAVPPTALGTFGLIKLIGASDPDQVNLTLIILSSIPIVLTVLLFFAGIKTEYSEDEIVMKFWPVFITKKIAWNQVSRAFIRRYVWNEFKATGSGAIPVGNRGVAYHLLSEYGLQLETREGNKILIGTRKPKTLEGFLKSLNKL